MGPDRVGGIVAEIRRRLLSGSQVREDIRAELDFHIQTQVDEFVEAGWERADAETVVLRRFGDPRRIGDEVETIDLRWTRGQRRREHMGTLVRDVRYALRSLRRNPLYAAIAILTMGLGIGATTAVFTVVDGIVLKPLPFHEPDRLVRLFERNRAQGIAIDDPSPPNFHDWREQSRSFEGLAAWMDVSVTLSDTEIPQILTGFGVTANFFDVLGVQPALGRGFLPDEEERDRSAVAVLSHGAWQTQFGGDPGIVGRAITLEGRAVEVVGVAPEHFQTPRPGSVWMPGKLADPDQNRHSRYLGVIGRLAPGVTPERAEADLGQIAQRLGDAYPDSNAGWDVVVVTAREQIVGDSSGVLMLIFGAVTFVLVLASANVASLLLGRGVARDREMAIRTALGAARSRLRTQMLREALVLGLIGGAVGTAIAVQGVRLFLALEPGSLPRMDEVGVDLRVLGFALLISVGSALAAGLLPALRVARGGDALASTSGLGSRSGGGTNDRLRRLLVAGEVALSIALLVGAGLFLRSFSTLRNVDPGFDRENVAVAKVSLGRAAYPTNAAKVQYFDELIERVEGLPGVRGAAITSALPMDRTGTDFGLSYHAQGHPLLPEEEAPESDYRIVSPGYFDAIGMQIVRGRAFLASDRADAPLALVITESFAEHLWPGEDPIGRNITIYYIDNVPWQVVGVVRDTRHHGLSVPPRHQMFVPMAQSQFLFGYMTVVVKGEPGVPLSTDAVRSVAASLDPSEPLYRLQDMSGLVAESIARDRFMTVSFGLFGVLALVLAGAGLYGVISFQVARRTHEIGVRMALGAERGRVVGDVLSDAARLALAGTLVGLLVSLALGRTMRAFLYEVAPMDPAVLVLVPLTLFGVAMVAAWLPARRAARVDPVAAMRSD